VLTSRGHDCAWLRVALHARSLSPLVKTRGFGITQPWWFTTSDETSGPSTAVDLCASREDQSSLGMTIPGTFRQGEIPTATQRTREGCAMRRSATLVAANSRFLDFARNDKA